MEKIQIENISSMQLHLELINKDYVYMLAHHNFFTKYKEGFYYKSFLSELHYISNETILKRNYLIKNNKVFYRPHIDFKMNNGDVITNFFNSENDCKKYFEELSKKYNFITIFA